MNRQMFRGCVFWCLLVCQAPAADYRVEALDEAAPADAISGEIAAQMGPTGLRIIRGSSRKICDIWLCKQWTLPEKTTAADNILFPFQPGQLIGVVRYHRKGADFRDQQIGEGVYTLRYALQPVDGDHIGTAPVRDFLLLLNARDDTSMAIIDYDTLVDMSAAAADTTHPAQLLLQRPAGDSKSPSLRHDEERDWWLLRCEGQSKHGEQLQALSLELVIIGHADE